MKNMNVETMNLQALEIQDACDINGGRIPSIVKIDAGGLHLGN
jgi:hypothetical protein